MRIAFFLEEIQDQPQVRDNFKRLQDSIDSEPLFKGEFKFFEIPVTAAGSNFTYKHNLQFVPKDIILLSKTAGGDVTFNFDLFDFNNINFTTTAALTFRCFIGRYDEGILR